MKLWKRNAVVAAIVLFVCVAVYLNWSYDQGQSVSGMGSAAANVTSERNLGEAALVNSDGALGLEEGVPPAAQLPAQRRRTRRPRRTRTPRPLRMTTSPLPASIGRRHGTTLCPSCKRQ